MKKDSIRMKKGKGDWEGKNVVASHPCRELLPVDPAPARWEIELLARGPL
jgi:hypothetical protein